MHPGLRPGLSSAVPSGTHFHGGSHADSLALRYVFPSAHREVKVNSPRFARVCSFHLFPVTSCHPKSLPLRGKLQCSSKGGHDQLRPFDVFEIQTAIDKYERRHPQRGTPSAEVALAWTLGWRSQSLGKRPRIKLEGEVGPLRWAYESFLVWWLVH
jgi:hypothetical protein